jgi:hypothetical protein
MDFLKGLFTRKSPLSSSGYNAVPRNNGANVFAGNNPGYSNNAARAPFKNLVNAYTRRNVSRSEKAQSALAKLRNLNRNSYSRFLNAELNRARSGSNLSRFSNDDLASLRGLADPQLGGRLYRKATRRNRRNRKSTRRNRKTRRN